ncbi:alpha/beta fold hydrolase [Streptosporangium sp. NPDC048865]|uniref:thioesterase II family protein n=1 Tax=Streptosporangium sp. NPDC048865 TaxID=3155766 RepID=UPI003441DD0A
MTATETAARSDWLRQFAPAVAGAPCVVVFPHAGGSAGFFVQLAQELSPAVRVLAVQYPGRLDRRGEPAVEDLRELARRIAAVVAEERPAAPLAFFGHSMGALVAFEAALLGERGLGVIPDLLFVSGGRAPALTRVDPAILRDDRSLIEGVVRLGGTSPLALEDEDLRELVLPALRSDYRALRAYVPAPGARVGCPIVALAGDRDPLAAVAEVERWRDNTSGAFRLRAFPGDHFYLTPRSRDVAETVWLALTGRD